MKIKKLMPMDAESRRLIDWLEQGAYDALQRKYLKTLIFCICEEEGPMIEEYAFSFSYPNTNTEEVAMNMSHTGSKKISATYKSNSSEVTPEQMRSSACKMIRTLISLTRTLDPMPEERIILMKLLYYDDATPEDYEPPFFKCCADNVVIHTSNETLFTMELGSFNSKHLVLDLKVKSILDPCSDNNANYEDDDESVENECNEDDECSLTEVFSSETDHYIVAADDNVKRLLKDGVLFSASEEGYPVNQAPNPKLPYVKKKLFMPNVSPTEEIKNNNVDLMYMKTLFDALPMDQVVIDNLQGKLDGKTRQRMMQKLIDIMVTEGIVEKSANQRSGYADVQSESSNKKLLEISKIVECNKGEKKLIDINTEHAKCEPKYLSRDYRIKDSSTMGGPFSITPDEMLTIQGKRGSRKASMGISYSSGFILCVNPKPALYPWRLDSGATNHMCGDNKLLKNRRQGAVPDFRNARDNKVNIDEMGDILGPRLRLYDVYLSSDLHEKEVYISVGQLTKEGYDVLINDEGKFTIHLSEDFNHIVGRGELNRESMAYFLDFFNGSVLERVSGGKETRKKYNEAKGEWTLDSGSPCHLTWNMSMFSEHWNLEQPMTFQVIGDKTATECWRQGNVSVPNFALNNVYFNGSLNSNLISVPTLNMIGYNFYYTGDRCYIYREEDFLDGAAHRDWENEVYYIEFLHPPKG